MSKKRSVTVTPSLEGYGAILGEVVKILEAARKTAAWSVNSIMTATYWQIGRRIVSFEQAGRPRAEYGQRLIEQLSRDLTARFGRGFGRRNLFQMRKFFLTRRKIVQKLSAQSPGRVPAHKVQKLSALSLDVEALRRCFPLPWSHYVRLLWVKDDKARAFYEAEALRGGWTFRQLERQITTRFYERTLLSRNKAAMLDKAPGPEDAVSPEEEIKDPFVLEFLGLKDEYSESDLEEALINQLEAFLLELGSDFAFIGRQRRLRIGDEWYRIDLLFFHRKLRSLIVIDLKLGKFTHADAGQMHLYLNYASEHWTNPGENPPVGLVLCTHKDEAVAHYALDNLPNKVLAAQYRLALPDEQTLEAELARTRRLLQHRRPKLEMGAGGK